VPLELAQEGLRELWEEWRGKCVHEAQPRGAVDRHGVRAIAAASLRATAGRLESGIRKGCCAQIFYTSLTKLAHIWVALRMLGGEGCMEATNKAGVGR
jgi:hypothetical protein